LVKSQARIHETDHVFHPKVHIVQAGETLSSVARKYGCTIEALIHENALSDPDHIYVRQHLRVPSDASRVGPTHLEVTETHDRPVILAGSARIPTSPGPKAKSPQAAQKVDSHSANSSAPPTPKKVETQETKAPKQESTNKSSAESANQRNAQGNPETVLTTAALVLSGANWCSKFPGSQKISDLNQNFRVCVNSFFAALETVGVKPKVNATLRPPERSYLMYNAFNIAKGKVSPDRVGRYAGVNIEWVHRDAQGKMDVEASKRAAMAMCDGYGLDTTSAKQKVGKPGMSRHNYGAAIDMNIAGYLKKKVRDACGYEIELKSFADLVKVGRSYGVIFWSGENMHWSDTGH
jgi:LysM repeat protein